MTIDGEIPSFPNVPYIPTEDLRNMTKREELINDIELELVNSQIDEMKNHLGKPGLLTNYVWRHLKRTIERSNPNYRSLAQRVVKNMEWRKSLAVFKAMEETERERRAVVFIQYATRILNVFDYVSPTTIHKYDFYDAEEEAHFKVLAQEEIDVQNMRDGPLRNNIKSSIGYGNDAEEYGFLSPAHSDTDSIRTIRNLDRAENASLYYDESSNASFFSVDGSLNGDN